MPTNMTINNWPWRAMIWHDDNFFLTRKMKSFLRSLDASVLSIWWSAVSSIFPLHTFYTSLSELLPLLDKLFVSSNVGRIQQSLIELRWCSTFHLFIATSLCSCHCHWRRRHQRQRCRLLMNLTSSIRSAILFIAFLLFFTCNFLFIIFSHFSFAVSFHSPFFPNCVVWQCQTIARSLNIFQNRFVRINDTWMPCL